MKQFLKHNLLFHYFIRRIEYKKKKIQKNKTLKIDVTFMEICNKLRYKQIK